MWQNDGKSSIKRIQMSLKNWLFFWNGSVHHPSSPFPVCQFYIDYNDVALIQDVISNSGVRSQRWFSLSKPSMLELLVTSYPWMLCLVCCIDDLPLREVKPLLRSGCCCSLVTPLWPIRSQSGVETRWSLGATWTFNKLVAGEEPYGAAVVCVRQRTCCWCRWRCSSPGVNEL